MLRLLFLFVIAVGLLGHVDGSFLTGARRVATATATGLRNFSVKGQGQGQGGHKLPLVLGVTGVATYGALTYSGVIPTNGTAKAPWLNGTDQRTQTPPSVVRKH